MVKYSKNEPLFTISVASQLTKLHPRTLMLYEKANLIKPFRTKTGRRRYSQTNLDEIKFIHYLTQEKRTNLAGVRVVFEILKVAKKEKLKIRAEIFPDFKP